MTRSVTYRRQIFTAAIRRLALDVAADPLAWSVVTCQGAAVVLDDMGQHHMARAVRATLALPRPPKLQVSAGQRQSACAPPAVAEGMQLDLFQDTAARPHACAALPAQRRN